MVDLALIYIKVELLIHPPSGLSWFVCHVPVREISNVTLKQVSWADDLSEQNRDLTIIHRLCSESQQEPIGVLASDTERTYRFLTSWKVVVMQECKPLFWPSLDFSGELCLELDRSRETETCKQVIFHLNELNLVGSFAPHWSVLLAASVASVYCITHRVICGTWLKVLKKPKIKTAMRVDNSVGAQQRNAKCEDFVWLLKKREWESFCLSHAHYAWNTEMLPVVFLLMCTSIFCFLWIHLLLDVKFLTKHKNY